MTEDGFEQKIAEASNRIIEANRAWLDSIACLFGEAEGANLDQDLCLASVAYHTQRAQKAVEVMESPVPPKKGP
ncbi:MAG: hypothetical protein COB16_19390 [Rhodobacteraceae bacterium]|nr:MAG: hypothetical protein COB16_19390 [Paracoccaceae bacterium]